MSQIGLIAAMNEECRPLLRLVEGWKKCRLGSFTGYRFRLAGQDCMLIQSGIGLQRAGEATRALINTTDPQLLVSFGVAGAVHDNLNIGDVVSIHEVVLLDKGIPGMRTSLAILSATALQITAEALQTRAAHILTGTGFTTRGSQLVQVEPPGSENSVLEMETSAIALVAAESNIPLLALRGISDNPQQPLPVDPDTVMDENYHLKLGKLVRAILRRPRIICQANRMSRNTAIAAENVAIAVIAALSTDPVIQSI